MKALLLPFAFIWGVINCVRRFLYRISLLQTHHLGSATISVGNLSMGGSGKTPVSIWIVKFLEENGLVGAVLSRGYKSKLEGSGGVLNDRSQKYSASDYGDEPLLIFKQTLRSDVFIGQNRIESFSKFKGSSQYDFILLDDGFQHLKIKRDLNILLVDQSLDFKNFKVAPQGYLREFPSTFIHADLIILTKGRYSSNRNKEKYQKFFKLHSIIELDFEITAFENEKGLVSTLNDKKIVVISAIANNPIFLTEVKKFGKVLDFHFYDDHHHFTLKDVEKIKEKYKEEKVCFVCTEKDYVKLQLFSWNDQLFFAKQGLIFLKNKEILIERLLGL